MNFDRIRAGSRRECGPWFSLRFVSDPLFLATMRSKHAYSMSEWTLAIWRSSSLRLKASSSSPSSADANAKRLHANRSKRSQLFPWCQPRPSEPQSRTFYSLHRNTNSPWSRTNFDGSKSTWKRPRRPPRMTMTWRWSPTLRYVSARSEILSHP